MPLAGDSADSATEKLDKFGAAADGAADFYSAMATIQGVQRNETVARMTTLLITQKNFDYLLRANKTPGIAHPRGPFSIQQRTKYE
jgi:hypothetical protein